MTPQRRDLVREVFQEIRVHGRDIKAVRPKTSYAPLFAYAVLQDGFMSGIRASGLEVT